MFDNGGLNVRKPTLMMMAVMVLINVEGVLSTNGCMYVNR